MAVFFFRDFSVTHTFHFERYNRGQHLSHDALDQHGSKAGVLVSSGVGAQRTTGASDTEKTTAP